MNILEHANNIVYERGEEKERQYGDFFKNMEDAASIASIMSKKEITAEDVYHSLIGLKFARESNTHKYDNIMDAIAYIASLHEYKESKQNKEKESYKDIIVKGHTIVSIDD
jgi:small nuclear ribonucleoprotein (snRNP)-like protein